MRSNPSQADLLFEDKNLFKMNFLENITFRRPNVRSMIELPNDEANSTCSPLDGSANSLPDSDDENTRELKLQIEALTIKLSAAQDEINSLRAENQELKSTLMIAKELQNDNLNKSKKTTLAIISDPLTKNTSMLSQRNDMKTQNDKILSEKKEKASMQSKICILSANKTNKIISIAEKNLQDFKLCHYITPNAGIKQIINNLHTKIKDFSKKDYCIILIGKEDFNSTNDYCDIIIHLRETLKAIENTNIILCLPTYKYHEYSTWFNCRIEAFNNLLCLDIQTHKYATLLDSNLELSCDFKTFSKYNGCIKDYGMNNIFENLAKLINTSYYQEDEAETSIMLNRSYCEDQVSKNNSEFFLL